MNIFNKCKEAAFESSIQKASDGGVRVTILKNENLCLKKNEICIQVFNCPKEYGKNIYFAMKMQHQFKNRIDGNILKILKLQTVRHI